MPDLTTLLSKFLSDLYAGTVGSTVPVTSITILGPGTGAVLTNGSTNVLNLAGGLVATAQLSAGTNVTVPATGSYQMTSAGFLGGNSVDGQFLLRNQAVTAGVGFDVATDATLKVRTRALADTAIVDASRFQAGGTGGVVTFGPAAVVSITVKGGIITAIS